MLLPWLTEMHMHIKKTGCNCEILPIDSLDILLGYFSNFFDDPIFDVDVCPFVQLISRGNYLYIFQ